MTKIAPLFWSFRSFSLILMQTPITITIESARFFETTIGVVRNALLYLLLLTMDCRERVRDRKKGRAKVICTPFTGQTSKGGIYYALLI